MLDQNKTFYEGAGRSGISELPEFYSSTRLYKAEEQILSSLRNEIKNESVLEIGVGGGRATFHLLPLCGTYIGIDYSERMVKTCRERFANATFEMCDARDLSMFDDGQFDAVFSFWNSLGDVDNEGRMQALKEVGRVLKADGLFVFSAHNLDWWDAGSLASRSGFWFSSDAIPISKNPFAFLRDNILCARVYAAGLLTRIQDKIHKQGYSLILEHGEVPGFVLPTYYIREAAQIQQLFNAGFHEVEAMPISGRPTEDETRVNNYSVYYIARKRVSNDE